MVSRKPLHLVVVLSLAVLGSALTPSSFLTGSDKDRLRKVFKTSLAQDDLSSVAHAVLGFKLLGETVPDSTAVCKKLQKGADGSDLTAAGAYQAVVASKAVDGCTLQLSAAASKVSKTLNVTSLVKAIA